MRILILGASGMIGHKLWQGLSARFDNVCAVLHKGREAFSWTSLYDGSSVTDNVDLSDFHRTGKLLDTLAPDVILNAVGITKRHIRDGNMLDTVLLNSALPHYLAGWCRDRGARVFQFSTDCVFSGKDGNYTEDSATDAEDEYGRTKAIGELRDNCAITLRTSFIGRELSACTELLEWFLAQEGGKIQGFTNAHYSGVTTRFLCRAVGDIIDMHPNLSGLYHLSSKPISKYELLCLARDSFGLDVEIEPYDGFTCKRTLDGSRLIADTGIKVPAWEEMMLDIAGESEFYSSRPEDACSGGQNE